MLSSISSTLSRQRKLNTSALCDADKSLGRNAVKVMSDLRARTRNCIFDNGPMVGVVRTEQLTESEDFLAVLRGLNDAKAGEVLCVNTMKSRKAVAGGLFLKEAQRKGLSGIIVDGTVRDIASMGEGSCFMYSKSVNPILAVSNRLELCNVT